MPAVPYAVISVDTPGTPELVTQVETSPTRVKKVHGVLFQVKRSNTGPVAIGVAGMVMATGEKCYVILPPPTATTIPSFSMALTLAPNSITLSDMRVDAENATDGVLVSILEA